ncbi:U3 small nucleolar RNA-associated protein [Entamoeba marina]
MNANTPSLNDLLSAIDNPQVQSKTKKDLDIVYGENSRIKKLGKVLEQHEVEDKDEKFNVFEEIKARRQKKIKSKKYHRILKHDKEREKRKEMELLNDEDPEAAAEFERKKEKQRLEERITQRHKSSNWSKDVKQKGLMKLADVRQAINEKDKIGKELSEKINKDGIFDEKKFFDGPQLDKNIRELLSQQHGIVDVDDDENEVDLDEAKAIAKDRLMLLEEIESKKNDGLNGRHENILNEFEDDEDDEHVVVVDQDNDLKGSTSGNITIDGDLIISTEDDQKMSNSIVNKSNTKVKQSEPVVSSLDQIMLDIKNNKLSVDEIGMEEDDLNNQYQQTYNEDDINDIDIEFDDNDKENKSLKKPKQPTSTQTKKTKKRVISMQTLLPIEIESTEPDNIMEIEVETTKKDEEKNIFQEDQKELLRLAFEGDDVMNELEEIDSANNKKKEVVITENLPGWGSWAGENSIVFNNKVDKKFIKYMVPELPKGYENQKDYKLHLNTSLGPEWTSLLAHKKLTRPEVVIRKGKNIAPLRHGKK